MRVNCQSDSQLQSADQKMANYLSFLKSRSAYNYNFDDISISTHSFIDVNKANFVINNVK